MKVCFFGHRDTSQEVYCEILSVIKNLIELKGAKSFFVGNEGAFDRMVQKALSYNVVLAYYPSKNTVYYEEYIDNSIIPDCIIGVPKRFAIDKRNRWMIDISDTVVTYVRFSNGGAAKFKELAERKGKTVIELAKK